MSKRSSILMLLVLLLLLASCFTTTANLALARSFISTACNHTVPGLASFSPECLEPLLSLLRTKTPIAGYNYKSRVIRKEVCHSFGHATCLETLTEPECLGCLSFLVDSLFPLCGPAVGAQLELPACFLRYEEYEF